MNGRWINWKDDDKYHILTKINKLSLLYTDKLPFWSLLHKARGKSLPTTSCTCASWRCCIIFQRMIWTISTCSLKAWGLVKSYESWCVCVCFDLWTWKDNEGHLYFGASRRADIHSRISQCLNFSVGAERSESMCCSFVMLPDTWGNGFQARKMLSTLYWALVIKGALQWSCFAPRKKKGSEDWGFKFSSWCGSSVHPFCDWVWCIAGHRCEGREVPSSRIEGGSLSSRVETECQILPNLKVRLQWCWHSHDIHDRSCFNQCLDDLIILFHHIPPVIQVLFCIGELLEERESGKTDEASKLSKRTNLKLRCIQPSA